MSSPILAAHTIKVYEALEAEAVDDIFQGGLVRTFDATGVSRHYYKRVFAILSDLSCLTVLSKGFAGNATVVQLHRKPTIEEVEAWKVTRGPHADMTLFESRLNVLEILLAGTNMTQLLAVLEDRFKALESRIEAAEDLAEKLDTPAP